MDGFTNFRQMGVYPDGIVGLFCYARDGKTYKIKACHGSARKPEFRVNPFPLVTNPTSGPSCLTSWMHSSKIRMKQGFSPSLQDDCFNLFQVRENFFEILEGHVVESASRPFPTGCTSCTGEDISSSIQSARLKRVFSFFSRESSVTFPVLILRTLQFLQGGSSISPYGRGEYRQNV